MNNMPAFPAPAGVSHITEQGMTLRDYFAAQAMQGLYGSSYYVESYVTLSDMAYKQADAMMRARGETK